MARDRAARQDEHGHYLELAMRSEATEEVFAARAHVDHCPQCAERVRRLAEIMERAGVLAPAKPKEQE